MINRIMFPRVAAVALAASALIAAPAAADPATGVVLEVNKRLSGNTTLSVGVGTHGQAQYHTVHHDRRYDRRHDRRYDRRHHGYGNEWGQSRKEVRRLKRDATRECRRAIRYEARNIGFYDIDFDDGRRVRQIGPYGFRVSFNEVEFEGRRREFERRVTCTVRRGQVRRVEGIPRPGRRAHRNNRYRY